MHRPALLPDDGLARALVVVGVATLVVGLVVGAVAPAAGVSGLGSPGAAGEPRQVDPAEVGSEGDLSAVERQLAEQLADRARSGAVNLSSDDIEQARDRINGTEYESLLDRYASVANQTGNTEQTLAYRRMLRAQSEFIEDLDRYNRIHRRYQALRNAEYTTAEMATARTRPDLREIEPGSERPTPANRTQIYRRAHQLSRLADEVNRTGTRLSERYRTLGNLSSRNFTAARAAVTRSVGNVTARQATVRDRTFVPTDLTVAGHSRTASFSDPLYVRGTVSTNGTGVRNGTITVTAGNQTINATTGPDGTFTLSYRPTQVPAGRSAVTVAYVPENDSASAPARDRFDVNFTRETPDIGVTVEPDAVSYGDRITVSGRVSVDDVGVPEAPYVVIADGLVLARNETDDMGRYSVSRRLPSSVADGEQPVRVLVPLENGTLTSASANTSVRVAELATELSAEATHVGGETVRVTGRLSQVNGGGVANETVDIAVNGTTVGTAETTANGSFDTAVAVPSRLLDGGLLGGSRTLVVATAYRDAGSNLGPSRVAESITVETAGQPVLLGGLAALVVALVGGAVLFRRRPWEGERDDTASDESGHPPGVAAGGVDDGSDTAASLLSAARDHLGSDPETAVRVGYAALRARIERRDTVPGDGRTHWEFYRDCEAADVDETTLETLRTVTERYEEVAYAADGVGVDAAQSTLQEVESLVDGSAGPDPGGSD
ncbi:hypothetical protein [Halosimplex marinum]|uniref:hypothetical protein n=1 Tax=Halosimplex marinum TaxID=3396620 RepID=UPI003F563DFB